MIGWWTTSRSRPFLLVVVVVIGFFSKHIETVDLVEYIEAANIGIRAQPIDFRPACNNFWVVAIATHFGSVKRNGVDISDPVPSHIDFWARVLAEYTGRIVGEQRAIASGGDEWDMNLV